MSGRVLYTGQAIIDWVMVVGAMPQTGGDVYADEWKLAVGGGFNTMAAAARDGAEVVYLGASGTGPFGDKVRQALATEGIASPNPPITEVDTGGCVAIVDATAERTFVSALGAEGRVGVEHLSATPIHDGDIVYVCGYSLCHTINGASLTTWLPTVPSGTAVVFDPAPLLMDIPDPAWAAIVKRATIWTLNAREAALVLERLAATQADQVGSLSPAESATVEGPADPAVLAERLAAVLGATVLVRDGAHGTAIAVPNQPTEHVAAHPVKAVDTNGAGDAHSGVLMASLARGEDIAAATRRANVAAAIAVTRFGPATSPTGDEINQILRRTAA